MQRISGKGNAMAGKRKTSRADKRERLLQAARSIDVPTTADVVVLGGGAAGITAAVVAAEQGASVVVLERDLACARTILATGNGRCNFANTSLDPRLYHNGDFVATTCGHAWLSDVLEFFARCGLAWAEEAEGRLYPLSRQAASVRNVLLQRAAAAGVVLAPAREATAVKVAPTRAGATQGLSVAYRTQGDDEAARTLRAQAVVVAVGGRGPALCTGLGLSSAPSTPLLCPLACKNPLLDALDGVRVRAQARLVRARTTVATEAGEVLFRPYGLSGIAVFNLSRHAQAGDQIVLDLLPTLNLAQARRLGTSTLDGLLDPKLAQVLLSQEKSTTAALTTAKGFELQVLGTEQVEHAQVTRGGLAVCQFDPHTLEAHAVPGLFACGEALDVDGPCGGFNLAWAWKSGMVAGSAAAERARSIA